MKSTTKMPSYNHKSLKQYRNECYSVSTNKKIILTIYLSLSIVMFLLAVKVIVFTPLCLLFVFLTYQLFYDIENDAMSKAKRMKKHCSIQRINLEFKNPPSYKFDQHVRIKMIELMKKDGIKVTK